MINTIKFFQVVVNEVDAVDGWEKNLQSVDLSGCNSVIINGVISFSVIPFEKQAREIYKAITGKNSVN